jgi:hypothetical protein
MEGWLGVGEDFFEGCAAGGEGLFAEVMVAFGEEVEEDDGGGGLSAEELDAGGGGVDAELEGVEVETMRRDDDDFAVEDATGGELREEWGAELGKVAVEGFAVAGLQEELVVVAEEDAAEAVPLGLEGETGAGGDGVDALGEHGEDRRLDGERHLELDARGC